MSRALAEAGRSIRNAAGLISEIHKSEYAGGITKQENETK